MTTKPQSKSTNKAAAKPSIRKRPTTKNSSAKTQNKDYRFVLSDTGTFVFISPDLATLWNITDPKSKQQQLVDPAKIRPKDVMTFADHDEAFDDRVFFHAGPNGNIFDPNDDITGVQGDTTQIWVSSIRDGCHTMICGKKKTIVDFQCDWITAPDTADRHKGDQKAKRYLVGSGPASPNIPHNEDKMRIMLHQILSSQNANDMGLKDEKRTLQQRPQPPVSARLKTDEINHFMDMSRDLMCTTHLDGSLIRFNRSFEGILGYSPDHLIGKSFMDFIYDEDRSLVRNAFYGLGYTESYNEHAKEIDFETRMKCSDDNDSNAYRWVHWQIRKEAGSFYCLGKDTTDIKAHEAQLERRRSELVEAQSLARMGNWRWTVGADYIDWSEQLYHVFGVEKEEFTPTMDNVNSLIHRRDIGKLYQAFQRAIIQQNDYDMTFRIKRPDGAQLHIRCEGRCELDYEGDVIALYGVMQDVTEQMTHQQELQTAKDAAETAYASKSRFLANMSHELRTPLNAIIGFSEMMEHQLLGPLGNAKYLDYVGGIRESGQHLLDLITDILDMSKIEAGKYDLDIEEFNAVKVIKLALHMMEGRAIEGKIKLTQGQNLAGQSDDSDDQMTIKADRRAVMQILLNLLSNAIKFTPENGTVSIECEKNDKGITFTVSDTGVGIPANKLANVLMPFEQAAHEHTRNHEGSGLGLSITKELAELHGGNIKISSQVNKGTIVRIFLPV